MFEHAYHEGEQAVQERYGVREKMAMIGRRVIRPFMPDQHRRFYESLPLLYVGSQDAQGRLWASVMVGAPGFVQTPDGTTMTISETPVSGDPLVANLKPGAFVGLLGLMSENRRRNRANGHITGQDGDTVTLQIDQSFGNCPKYIQIREATLLPNAPAPEPVIQSDALTDRMQAIVGNADTFFIASATAGMTVSHEILKGAYGVDMSHRGGPTGFARLLHERQFVYPDYSGNLFFNTLGNLTTNPRSGYLFLDYLTGATLQLTGHTEIIYDPIEEVPFTTGAQRMLRFTLTEARLIEHALPLRWSEPQFSPHLPE